MKDLIFVALLVAGLAHVFEEYVYPGGFPEAQAKLLPRAVHLFTPMFHVLVNGVFLLLCLAGALVGKANLVFSLSVFGLIFTNGLLHIRGSIIQRGYYPGVISAVLLYIPLTIYAYSVFLMSGELTVIEGVVSALLGVLYMGILMAYVLLSQVVRPHERIERVAHAHLDHLASSPDSSAIPGLLATVPGPSL